MYTLTLDIVERDTLKELLECSLSELHTEIVHTDNRCFKQALKDRKEVLLRMLNELQPPAN
jgi:hypothetical protein